MFNRLKTGIPLVIAVACVLAAPAAATSVIVSKAKFDTSAPIVRLNLGPAGFMSAYASPAQLTINGTLSEVLWYCIDPFTAMPNGNLNPPGNYDVTTLPMALSNYSAATIGKVGWLIQQGSGPGVTSMHSFITQAAIWSVQLGAGNVTSQNGAFMTSVNALASSAMTNWSVPIMALDNTDKQFPRQSFAGAVPEPASWAMLIAGFGLVGAVARRRRPVVAA